MSSVRPKRTSLLAIGLLALSWMPGVLGDAHGQGRGGRIAWAPKPVELSPYVEPHRPLWSLADILAEHDGQQNWTVTIVDDELLKAEYISMAPGESTPTKFYADNRAWWVVQGGQIRFTIEGEEPFVASKGCLVQVPYRVPFSMETVGDEPSLRFEVTVAGASALYPEEEAPEPVDGQEFVQVSISGQGSYDDVNTPYLDFLADVVEGERRGGPFVDDDRGFANIIRGRGQPPPPDTDRGHFHLDYSEFWLILEGEIDYLIEGEEFFTAQEGDVVYVPEGRFHRATFGGDGMSTRLAINGYPDGLHNWEPRAEER